MEPRPWNISITRSDSLVRVDVQTMGKRWKCCGEIRGNVDVDLKTIAIALFTMLGIYIYRSYHDNNM